MYTSQSISEILKPLIISEKLKKNKWVRDFEIDFHNIISDNTALFNISEESWSEWFNYKKKRQSNFHLIKKNLVKASLIITDEPLPYNYKGDFIMVENTFKAMNLLAKYFRKNYNNPLIAITGSFGKSSTRMMIETVLEDFTVLHNVGNANMRIPILLNLCKLIQNPDFAVFEVSLNALNNKGNMATLIQPDIAIITGIGEAHLSTVSGTKEIAEFKGRIFEGLSSEGTAIINGDTLHTKKLKEKALSYTKKIYFYSLENDFNNTFFKIHSIQYLKSQTKITININGGYKSYTLNSLSEGMVANSLAVIQVIIVLGLELESKLNKLVTFKPLPKVLEVKEIKVHEEMFTIIDDTHNASLPAMINAIKTFDSQSHFYEGTKIIALGKINDLGKKSKKAHMQLVPLLSNSSADYILCLDEELKPVVNRVKGKVITWYKDVELLLNDLCSLLSPDSITLLKSSITGTSFPEVSKRLPTMIKYCNNKSSSAFHSKNIQPAVTFVPNNQGGEQLKISSNEAIEGLTPLFYYIYAKSLNIPNRPIKLKQWPTNNTSYYEGKVMMLQDLVKHMILRPHPSLVYQMENELFSSEETRIKKIGSFIELCDLSKSSIINVTGRYTSKERHQFKHKDLYNIYDKFREILFKDYHKIIFGYDKLHGIMKTNTGIFIFTSYDSEWDLLYDCLSIEKFN
ncbi:UDP-N-acetylmuramoyl-tripeptide--D-alanyl-D-alanine ligase [Staphylococcus agnetis]|uniref:Mur ligase family protein n=1 Tax=Staphylococcus agnetis TaxID=985762 RepID=UPI00208F8217|nr:UDP-N-acetylmuramoyl-tripeptide--D-alanyl-D-alanine ligase [Staphylococcus agnetis]MCO4327825.1 UDP-N-acetylmuramoyl-tripeptide--D-alanyl-D-alanine ligase [Staphylococcus agnetis]MCO4370398.1 UDP-N-acetylmuramoyl-tripeptide--D-alanyl-D-alanine ligase [Staphylococcus agnetis]